MKTVDVLIPVYRPDERLKKIIDRLMRQSYPVKNIILINTEKSLFDRAFGGSDPFAGYGNVRVRHITKEQFDHGATRRMLVAMSDADLFICMTDDALPVDRQLVEKLLAPLLKGEAAVAYARQLAGRDSDIMEKISRRFNYPPQSRIKTPADLEWLGIKSFFCSNVCAAYDRRVYETLGGFEKNMIFNEDMVYAGRLQNAGENIAYVAEARVLHSHHYTALQQLKRNFDLGVSQAQFPELFERVSSASEGVKLIRLACGMLLARGEALKIPGILWLNACKYAGYKLGKNYTKLPEKMIGMLTMNKEYWKHRR